MFFVFEREEKFVENVQAERKPRKVISFFVWGCLGTFIAMVRF